MRKKILLAIFLLCSIKSLSQVNASQKFNEASMYINKAHALISKHGNRSSIRILYQRAHDAYVEVLKYGQKRFRNRARYWAKKMDVQIKKYS